MKDLFAPEPFHKELHEIMLRKGYKHMRVYDKFIQAQYDIYGKNEWRLSFWDDDFILMVDDKGAEAPLDVFMSETDNIFDPDRLNKKDD
jgi:hypothetical protein